MSEPETGVVPAPTEPPKWEILRSSKDAQDLVATSDWGFPRSIVAATWAQYPELTRPELGRFLFEADRLKLDPATGRQIMVVIYNKNKPTRSISIQIGIAGFRLIAARTGLLDGSADVEDGPEVTTPYKGDNGTTVTIKHPQFCRAKVWRKGSEHPFEARVRWEERVKFGYGNLPTEFWVTQPYGQLEKCAEAAALRKAFPMETRGVTLEGENLDPFPGAVDTTAAPAPVASPGSIGPGFAPSTPQRTGVTLLNPNPAPPPAADDLEPLIAEVRGILNGSSDTALGARMNALFNARMDAMGGPTFVLGKATPFHRPALEALRDDLRQLERTG